MLPTAEETVPQVFRIMNAFDIRVGAVRDVRVGEAHCDYIVSTSVADLENLRRAFRTYEDQSLRGVEVRKSLDAARGEAKVIPMDSSQTIEDVSTTVK